MLNAHYRTCNLTPKHEYVILHTHSRTCTLPRKRYDYPYLRAATASLRTGERSDRCPLGLLLHTGATPMGNGNCSLGLPLHTGATSKGNISGWSGLQQHSGHFGGKCRNLSSRSEEAGVRRLGPQSHTGVTSAGNVKEFGEFALFRRNVHVGHFGGKCRIFFQGQRRLESGG